MVVIELLEALVSWAFDSFGVGGVSAGAVAIVIGLLWYSREAAGIMVGLARYLKIGSVIGGLVAIGVIVGVAVGAVSVDSGILAELLELTGSIAEAI